jgi:hypothetical protein
MKNLHTYEKFRLNENENLFFTRHNQPAKYKDRARVSYGLPDNPTILQRTRNFFEKIEDRLQRMADEGGYLVKQNRYTRGGGPNTGVELLFGLPTIVPNILKRVFGPTKAGLIKNSNSDSVDVEFMRHTNEDFVREELPSIRTEKQLEDNVSNLYRKAKVRRGEVPVLDDIANNRANLFYTRQINPNHQVLQVNNP